MKSIDYKLQLLLTIFVSCLLLGNLLGSKRIEIFGIITSVGFFEYPLTFLITDIVVEVKGKEASKIFVHSGFLSLCIAFFFVSLSTGLPPSPTYYGNEAYTTVFSSSLRIIAASVTAFLISQLHDIWAFSLLKQKTNGRYLWFRNSLSTIVSQLIDSVVFMFLAFYKVTPEVDAVYVLHMILPLWTLKIGFSILDTPLVYLGVRWLTSENEDLSSGSEMNREVGAAKVKTGQESEQILDPEISSQR